MLSNATAIEHPCLLLDDCYFDCTPRARCRLAQRCCHRVRRRFARRCLCRAWPSCAPVSCPSLPLLRVAIASMTICLSLHSLRRPPTCPASPLPHAPAICLSLPLSCVAITSVAVCPSLPLPHVVIVSVAISPYLRTPRQLLAQRCPCLARHQFTHCRLSHLPCVPAMLSVTSCRLHSCSHCQLLNPFLADCCNTSCCPAASRHL